MNYNTSSQYFIVFEDKEQEMVRLLPSIYNGCDDVDVEGDDEAAITVLHTSLQTVAWKLSAVFNITTTLVKSRRFPSQLHFFFLF